MSKKTAKDHLFSYLDGLTAGSVFVLSGWQLYDEMYALTGKKTTPATLVAYVREYASRTKSTVKYTGRDMKYWFVSSGVRLLAR